MVIVVGLFAAIVVRMAMLERGADTGNFRSCIPTTRPARD